MAGPREQRAKYVLEAEDRTKGALASAQRNFEALDQKVLGLGGSLGLLGGALTLGGFAAFITSGVGAVAALDDLAERTTLSVETLDSLSQVARIGGHDMEAIATTASKFAKSVAEANGGNKELIQSFKQLGFTQQELRSGGFDTLYVKFAQNVATATDRQNALAVGADIAGKALATQIPFFRDLAEEGLNQSRVSAEQAAQAEALQKTINRLGVEFDRLIKFPVAIAILDIATALGLASKQAIDFGDRLKLAFSGDINIGRFTELVKEEQGLLGELANVESRTFGERILQGPDAGRRRFLEERIAYIRTEKAELERLMQVREAGLARPAAAAEAITVGAPRNAAADAQARSALERLARDEERLVKDRSAREAKFQDELTDVQRLGIEQREKERMAESDRINQEIAAFELGRDEKSLIFGNIVATEAAAASQAGLGAQLEKNRNLAHELGLTFASAAEDAIVGFESVGDVLKGLERDLERLAVRKFITEPFLGAAQGIFEQIFAPAGGGGGGAGVIGAFVSALTGAQSGMDFVPRDMPVFVHRGERIVTAEDNARAQQPAIVQHLNFAISGPTDRRSQEQIGAAVFLASARASRRNN